VNVNQTTSITVGAAVPSTPSAGQTVSFPITYGTGTGASPITRMTVDWGDGTTSNLSGAPLSIFHAYSSPGSYLVTVVGFDALGDTSNGSNSVTVSPRARPTVTISPADNPQLNVPLKFNISATTTTGNTIVSVAVDFGDGASVTLPGNATSVTHVYTAPGTYVVTATATDNSGQSGQATTVIILVAADAAPTAGFSISPASGTKSTEFLFNGSDSTGTGLSYAWDFGDGSFGSGLTTSHKYGQTGTFVIRLTVTDSKGRTATKTMTLTVTT
jgi:PKD repeat protein